MKIRCIDVVLLAVVVLISGVGSGWAEESGIQYRVGMDEMFSFSPHWQSPVNETNLEFDHVSDGVLDEKDLLEIVRKWPSHTPTPIPGPKEIIVNIPGLPAGAKPLTLVRIPAGSFQMGSPDTERGRWFAEGPVHTVNIGYDFYMGKWEVTQAQWEALMGTNPVTDLGYTTYGVGDDYPVYYVSWDDIRGPNGFIEKLNALGQGTFLLPSESEWEYACRAGTSTRFFFGDSLGCDDYDEDCAAGVLPGNRSDYMWYEYNKNNPTYGCKPVGTKLPNQFGLYDMSGNLWEWCYDDWHGSYNGAPTDGSAWVDSPRGSFRVLRGGGWKDRFSRCRSADRGGNPDLTYFGVGFRISRTP